MNLTQIFVILVFLMPSKRIQNTFDIIQFEIPTAPCSVTCCPLPQTLKPWKILGIPIQRIKLNAKYFLESILNSLKTSNCNISLWSLNIRVHLCLKPGEITVLRLFYELFRNSQRSFVILTFPSFPSFPSSPSSPGPPLSPFLNDPSSRQARSFIH